MRDTGGHERASSQLTAMQKWPVCRVWRSKSVDCVEAAAVARWVWSDLRGNGRGRRRLCRTMGEASRPMGAGDQRGTGSRRRRLTSSLRCCTAHAETGRFWVQGLGFGEKQTLRLTKKEETDASCMSCARLGRAKPAAPVTASGLSACRREAENRDAPAAGVILALISIVSAVAAFPRARV